MDPWEVCERTVKSSDIFSEKSDLCAFEDNFRPLVRDALPDSKEYLAILENKLNQIRADQNILKQLAEKREACMQQLLSDPSMCMTEESSTLAEPIKNNVLLRTIAPEKQALTQGEIVELVKYDQLVDEEIANIKTEHSTNEDESSD